MNTTMVSVIIPVYNDPRIDTCLRALEAQTYPRDLYEIIVVDNGSSKEFYTHLKEANIVQKYSYVCDLNQKQYIKYENYAATANVFIPAEVIRDVSVFDSLVKSGGDKEMGNRINNHNYALLFSPDAKVYHPTRKSLKELILRNRRIAGGVYDSKFKNMSHSAILKRLFTMTPSTILEGNHFEEKMTNSSFSKLTIFKIKILHNFFKIVFVLELIRLKLGGESERR